MKWSLYLGKVAGIRMYIHWTFLLLLVWLAFVNLRQGNSTGTLLYNLMFLAAVFLCVVLHELGHALMAQRYHIVTEDITLLPIGGLARMREMPENPKQELLVALAGPAVNLVLAALLYIAILLIYSHNEIMLLQLALNNNFLVSLFAINIILAVFNLIPAFPMDGGRVLRAALSFGMDRTQATRIAAGIGQVIAILFIAYGLFANPILMFIGFFVFLGAQAESSYVQSNSLLKNFKVSDALMQQFFSLQTNNTVGQAVELLLDVQVSDFIVMEGDKVVGTLNRNAIIRALRQKGEHTTVREVMNTEVAFLEPNMPLDRVYKELRSSENNVMPVLSGGRLIGILDIENIFELIMVQNARMSV